MYFFVCIFYFKKNDFEMFENIKMLMWRNGNVFKMMVGEWIYIMNIESDLELFGKVEYIYI